MNNAELTMYEKLLSLPLFQGLSKNDITHIVEKEKFHFQKYKKGEEIAKQGEDCNEVIFMLQGQLYAETNHPEYGFSITETYTEPIVIEPYSLFGKSTQYISTYRAKTDSDLISISKGTLVNTLNTYSVFRLNYSNLLSSRIYDLQNILTQCTDNSVEQKIIHFILRFTQKPSGEVILKIKMEHFAELIDETRINVSKVLNRWVQEGYIELKRKEIVIPDFKKIQSHILL